MIDGDPSTVLNLDLIYRSGSCNDLTIIYTVNSAHASDGAALCPIRRSHHNDMLSLKIR